MSDGRTDWRRVLVVLLAGFAVAFQIGKVPAAIPLLREELALDLIAAGSVVSTFSILTATCGLLMGRVADRYGHLRVALASLLISALAALAGGFSAGLASLLLTRVIEGLGFILAVVALPPLIVACASTRDRPLVLGIWGAFVPGGMSIMLLASPLLIASVGWRGLWAATAVLILCCFALLRYTFRRGAPAIATRTEVIRRPGAAREVLRRGPLLLAAGFAAYSAQFTAVTAFLPSVLIELDGLQIAAAASLSALVVAANVVGNVASGWLLRRGITPRRLLIAAHCLMALATVAVFHAAVPLSGRVAAALVFSSVGGLLPGGTFASVPVYVARPANLSAAMGLLIQGAGIGQVLGPLLISNSVGASGDWRYAALATGAAAAVGIACAASLPRRNGAHRSAAP